MYRPFEPQMHHACLALVHVYYHPGHICAPSIQQAGCTQDLSFKCILLWPAIHIHYVEVDREDSLF